MNVDINENSVIFKRSTGEHTAFAAHAQAFVHEYDAVLGPLLHGTRRTGGHAPRTLAMKAGHEYVRGTGKAVNVSRSDGHDLGGQRPEGKSLGRLAMNLTAQAPDAIVLILEKIILAHDACPPDPFEFNGRTCTKVS